MGFGDEDVYLLVGEELGGAVGEVEEFGGDVSFPEGGEAFLGDDCAHCGEDAAVEGAIGEVVVCLELETDLDDVEGGDDEAGRVREGGGE